MLHVPSRRRKEKGGRGEKLQNVLPDPATFSEITSIKSY